MAGGTACFAFGSFLGFGLIKFTLEGFSSSGVLARCVGVADGPWIEEDAGTGEEITGVFVSIGPFEDVAVFFSNITVFDVESAGLSEVEGIGGFGGSFVEQVKVGKPWGVAGGKDMEAGEVIGIAELDGDFASGDFDVVDVEGLQFGAFEVAVSG